MSYLLNEGFKSTIFLLLPALLIIGLFIYFKKKKDEEAAEKKRFGRRGSKDHTWQILKEYHKKTNQIGSSIEEKYLFDRPNPEDLHEALVKGMLFRWREEQKKAKKKFLAFQRKPKYPKRFDAIEDYFEKLEQETLSYRKARTTSQKIEDIRSSSSKKKSKRKRYVVIYKVKQKGVVSPWLAVEVELIKQVTKDGKTKDTVVVNKELDVGMELTWLEPLLHEQIMEKSRREIESKQRAIKVQKRASFYKKVGGLFKKGNS